MKYADACIFISENDRDNVLDFYKCNLAANYVIPPALEDTFIDKSYKEDNYFVFFGSAFFANFEAIDFLIKIAPRLNAKIIIFGEHLKHFYPGEFENLKILNISTNYDAVINGASAFVDPIFSGSGANIKIADALMHGKHIIATKKALSGYDVSDVKVDICGTEEEFIETLNNINHSKKFYKENRDLFLLKYSLDVNNSYYEWINNF